MKSDLENYYVTGCELSESIVTRIWTLSEEFVFVEQEGFPSIINVSIDCKSSVLLFLEKLIIFFWIREVT